MIFEKFEIGNVPPREPAIYSHSGSLDGPQRNGSGSEPIF